MRLTGILVFLLATATALAAAPAHRRARPAPGVVLKIPAGYGPAYNQMALEIQRAHEGLWVIWPFAMKGDSGVRTLILTVGDHARSKAGYRRVGLEVLDRWKALRRQFGMPTSGLRVAIGQYDPGPTIWVKD